MASSPMQQMRVGNKFFPWKLANHIQSHDNLMDVSSLIDESTVPNHKVSFNLGITILKNRVEASMSGREAEEQSRERFCVVMQGASKVKIGATEYRLNSLDCLYAPSGTSYSMGEADGNEAIFFWVLAPPFSVAKQEENIVSEKNAQIIRIQEVNPSVVLTEPPDRRTSYEMIHGTNFNVGLVRRPSGAYGPLHTHDPPDCEEAYVSIQGVLQITDVTGVSKILQPFDSLYVPPYGGNSNRNIGSDECVYAYVEYPAIGVKEIPVN
jgi:mannose-6-phosphate isomerase-like protein (cupin superfamily)